MLDFLDGWLVWLGLGGGTLGLLVAAVLFPSALGIARDLFGAVIDIAKPLVVPLAKAAGSKIAEYASYVVEGFWDTLDNRKRIAFAATLAVCCYGAGSHVGQAAVIESSVESCKPVIDRLHQCYWFRPKSQRPAFCGK